MKTIVIGDLHGHATWKQIVRAEKADRVIFVGDYFDSFNISCIEQMYNVQCILQYKKDNPDVKVVLLIGNHDLHYYPEVGYNGTSGYQPSPNAVSISALLNEHREHFTMAYSFDNYLFTHAGVGQAWMERIIAWEIVDKLPNFNAKDICDFVNSMWKHKPLLFNFIGNDPYGDSMGQTPVWIRPKSLMRDSQDIKKEGVIQIVGHTPQKKIDIAGHSTGSKYYFIDTLGSSGEYLIIENNLITSKSWRDAVLQNTI